MTSADEPPAEPAEGGNIVQLSDARENNEVSVADISDDSLALRFIAKHGDVIRYVGQWSRWMIYTGKVWEVDYNNQATELARKTLREWAKRIFAGELQRGMAQIPAGLGDFDKKNRIRNMKKNALSVTRPMRSYRTINNVAGLASHDDKVVQTVDTWDSDPWLLNTPDGTVDLKGGFIRGHNPKDYMTMTTKIGPSNVEPVRWKEFIKQITDGDSELASYLQRILGYCLTGMTGEQAMFFAFGSGANGKSVILKTVGGLLGSYHKTAAMETFILTGDRHPTELANLRGARMVTSTETQSGRKWDEVKIKRLTGGDFISARFMRQDFFEFLPQFKLFVAGNHKPSINNVDEAMRRRFNLIPFTVTIPPEQRDHYLGEKLAAEWGGILSWMIDGCTEWQKTGLQTPTLVKEATERYMSLEDHFGAWWAECCETNPRGFTTVADLYESWAAWASKNGDIPGGKKTFSQTVAGRAEVLKIRYYQSNEGRGFRGVSLKGKS